MFRFVGSGFDEGEDDGDSRPVHAAVGRENEDVADDADSPLCSRALLHRQRSRITVHPRCNPLRRRCCHLS